MPEKGSDCWVPTSPPIPSLTARERHVNHEPRSGRPVAELVCAVRVGKDAGGTRCAVGGNGGAAELLQSGTSARLRVLQCVVSSGLERVVYGLVSRSSRSGAMSPGRHA